jgi:hypothetical protein
MPKFVTPSKLYGDNSFLTMSGTVPNRLTTAPSAAIAIGQQAMGGATAPPADTIGIGSQALWQLTNGATGGSVAIGTSTLYSGSTGGKCVAVGTQALTSCNAIGSVGVGYQAGTASTAIGTFVGYQAGLGVTTGAGNTMVGYLAGTTTTGSDNTMVGYQAGKAVATGTDNTMVGYNAGLVATASTNTAIGASAGAGITTGLGNTCIGYNSGSTVTTTSQNVGIGVGSSPTGGSAIAIGNNAVATAQYNIAIGANTTASNNGCVAIGVDNAGNAASTNVPNEFKFGVAASRYNFPGQLSAALNAGTQKITNLGTPTLAADAATMAYVDSKAGAAVTGTANRITVTGTQIDIAATYVGQASITTVGAITSGEWRVVIGTNNTRLGSLAGAAITTGTDNTHVGYKAGNATTANYSTLLGSQAGAFLSSGSGHTAIGYGASGNGGTSTGQTAVGYLANNTSTASYSTAIGYSALATGAGSVAIGCDSGGSPVSTSVTNEIKLGNVNHTVNIPGALIVAGSAVGGGVSATLFDANTILKADVDNTPLALTVAASTIVGRGAAGGIAALTAAQAKAVLAITPTDVSGFDTQVRTSRLDQMAVPAAAVNLNNQPVNNGNYMSFSLFPPPSGTIRLPVEGTINALHTDGTTTFQVLRATNQGVTIGGRVGFFNVTPANQDTGWTVGSYTPFRAGISSGITASDCANVLSTLITVLKGYGLLG